MQHRRTIILWLCLLLCVGLVGCQRQSDSDTSATTTNRVRDERRMVVLGDSIAAGYGLDAPDTESYSSRAAAALSTDTTQWTVYNYAVTGDTSSQLRKRLTDGRAVRLPSADVITVCIGANNLLEAYGTFLATYGKAKGDAQTIATAFATMETQSAAGMETLRTDLPAILQWIREKNANAAIFFLNLYHPYANLREPLVIDGKTMILADYAKEKIDACNAILQEFADTAGVAVVDVASAFAACDTLPIVGTIAGQSALLSDPHPNAEGHRVIAEALCKRMEEMLG